MVNTADAVVMGGGVTGASITFHLARLGLKVIYKERQRPLIYLHFVLADLLKV